MPSELDIINHVLNTSGLNVRVVTSTSNMHPQALSAQTTIRAVSEEFQMHGWWFNQYLLTLSPTQAGEVLVPDQTLKADPVDTDYPYMLRGNRFFDPSKATFEINRTMKVVVTQHIPLDDLPSHASNYIQHLSALRHYENRGSSTVKIQGLRDRAIQAKTEFDEEYMRVTDTNVLKNERVRRMYSHTRGVNESAIQRTVGYYGSY